MEIFIEGEMFSGTNLTNLKQNLNKAFAYLVEDVCIYYTVPNAFDKPYIYSRADKIKIEKAVSYFIRMYNKAQELFEVSVIEASKETAIKYRLKLHYKSKGLLSLNKRLSKINYYMERSDDEEVLDELMILKQKIESTKGKKWSEVKDYVIMQEKKADFIYGTYGIW